MKNLIVEKKYDNHNLIFFLQEKFDGLSKSTIYKALRKKDVIINGIRIKENAKVFENDSITLYITDDLLFKTINIQKVYEDNNILVVFKPIDLEVVSTGIEQTLTSIFEKDYTFIKPCHRLDRNTKRTCSFC